MAYCRKNEDSDIYVMPSDHGEILVCLECELRDGIQHFRTRYRSEMLRHLLDHAKVGHDVPEEALHRLHEEKKVANTYRQSFIPLGEPDVCVDCGAPRDVEKNVYTEGNHVMYCTECDTGDDNDA